MPFELPGNALAALHRAETRNDLCRALDAGLKAAGLPSFTLLVPGTDGDRYGAAWSTALDEGARRDLVLVAGDPLLATLSADREFLPPALDDEPAVAPAPNNPGLSALFELQAGSVDRPVRTGYLLFHGLPLRSPEAADLMRMFVRHFELALDRQCQMDEYRTSHWNSTEALAAMNEMGALMGTLDLRILLAKILQLTLHIANAEVGSIVFSHASGVTSEFEWGFTHSDLESLRTPDGGLFLEEMIKGGEPIYVPNVYLDDRLDTGLGMLPIDSLAVLPLVTSKGTLGAINVVNVSEETGFSADRLSTLKTICSLAAIAIENARYYEEALKNESLKEQARIAETIQRGFFPRTIPEVPGFELAGRTEPAQFIGGDYYDYIQLPEGRLGLAVADVSGHGISAGLVMTLTRTFFRAAAPQVESPAELFKILNAHLMAEDLNGAYVTFMYGILDPVRRTLRMASAGHVPVVHYHAAADSVELIEITGLPIGMFEEAEYEERIVTVEPGDRFLFITDGVVEAMSPLREQFGDDRVGTLIRRHRADRPQDVLEMLHAAVRRHTHPGAPHDDVTTVLLHKLPEAA